MGYIRKNKHEIRHGFEAILIMGTALMLAPVTIVIAAYPSLLI